MEMKKVMKAQATSSSLSKAHGSSDSKKNQDVKVWPGQRNQQRRRYFDPLPQGGAHKQQIAAPPPSLTSAQSSELRRVRSRTHKTKLETDEKKSVVNSADIPKELSNVKNKKRANNANHLLNFHYSHPHGTDGSGSIATSSRGGGRISVGKKKTWEFKRHQFNKEQYLQANCQFVVNPSGNYNIHNLDPDILVDWNFIEQINVQVFEFAFCPICLYPPVAAKMTRCGHIYCWSCILHYLALSDKESRKCPICEQNVQKSTLKSVVSVPRNTFKVNDQITFKLMKKGRDSFTATKIDEELSKEIQSKLIIANVDEIKEIIVREEKELKAQLLGEDENNHDDDCFINEALKLLEERKISFEKMCGELPNIKKSEEKYESFSPEEKFSFFYQAADGQHIYLHAINAKMIEYTYGTLQYGPKTITGRILEKEEGSIDAEIRIRYRYLQHLPLTSHFEFVEIQLGEPYVTPDTILKFKDEINKRKKNRKRRENDEKIHEKRIELETNRQIGKFPEMNIQCESQMDFPDFEPSRRHNESISSTQNENYDLEGNQAGISFAKVVSTKKEAEKWPSLSNTPSDISQSEWCKINSQKYNVSKEMVGGKHDSENEEERAVATPLGQNLGDVLLNALTNAHDPSRNGGNSNKKGKKKKKMVLYNSSMFPQK